MHQSDLHVSDICVKQRLMEQTQNDMTTMLMGKMMALIQGRKIAEDDEHTEV